MVAACSKCSFRSGPHPNNRPYVLPCFSSNTDREISPASGIHGEPLGFCKSSIIIQFCRCPCLAFWRHGFEKPNHRTRRPTDIRHSNPRSESPNLGTQSPSASQTWATRQTRWTICKVYCENCARLPSIGQEGKGARIVSHKG